jgi:DNA-directed RNA polymerase specialized sigma24 family protein
MTPADAETYRKYADELVRFASGLVGPSGAEDVVATAVLRAVSGTQWSRVDNQRAYMYRAVLNEASS